ncbi:SGNH/GDSL hydrolase family protein [Paenibacillus guangzhouensis]|uniref:SGNH/GDSL hydrolase family protein n=1 Tax=Paenibacillus guangzhouensis TaxID=1473112 RepID=UPI001266BF4B|nr:SGNH/GDSL hydrolase family protein [Paenibacillus guangzhouensis]
MTFIQPGEVILFQGDSVTDCARHYNNPDDMGNGYANMVAGLFSALYPKHRVQFFNRGISGNRVVDLQSRWQADCLDLKPNWVSILIGINDVWRRYDSNDPTSVEQFKAGYRDLLRQTKEKLGAKLIICEPFVLPVPEDRRAWREDLDPKIQAVRELAAEFEAIYIPLDGLFAQHATETPPAYWAEDGVHPSVAGNGLIAKAWLQAVQAI